MKILIADKVPEKYASQKGTTYETRFIYTGLGRYNEHTQCMEWIEVDPDGSHSFSIKSYTLEVLSRSYHVEHARVTVYSESPRVWKEEIGLECFFFYEIVHEGPQPNF
jgi:hypothetical protein